jgi:GNAT superfamily N-acetyltransferase
VRRARPDDILTLVSLMAVFYAEAGYNLDRERAASAFATLIADERLGCVWIIEVEREKVGHVVVTLRYAMEYGGLIACLDDLYVKPAWRNKGLAGAALAEVRKYCETAGIRAMTVEVGYGNVPAQTVYRRAGFVEAADRQLLVMALAAPSHVVGA